LTPRGPLPFAGARASIALGIRSPRPRDKPPRTPLPCKLCRLTDLVTGVAGDNGGGTGALGDDLVGAHNCRGKEGGVDARRGPSGRKRQHIAWGAAVDVRERKETRRKPNMLIMGWRWG
jgi:hypothetical protein